MIHNNFHLPNFNKSINFILKVLLIVVFSDHLHAKVSSVCVFQKAPCLFKEQTEQLTSVRNCLKQAELEKKRLEEQKSLSSSQKEFNNYLGSQTLYFPEDMSLYESGKFFVSDYTNIRQMYSHILGGLKILPFKVAIDEFEPLVGKNLQHFQESMISSSFFEYHKLAHAQQELFTHFNPDKENRLKSLQKKLSYIQQAQNKDLFEKSSIPYLEETLDACEKGRITGIDFIQAQKLKNSIATTLNTLKESKRFSSFWDSSKDKIYNNAKSYLGDASRELLSDTEQYLGYMGQGASQGFSAALDLGAQAQETTSLYSEEFFEHLMLVKDLEEFTKKYFPHLFDETTGKRFNYEQTPLAPDQSFLTYASLFSQKNHLFNSLESAYLTLLLGSENYKGKTFLPLSAQYKTLLNFSTSSWQHHHCLKNLSLELKASGAHVLHSSKSTHGFDVQENSKFLSLSADYVWLEKIFHQAPLLERALLKYWKNALSEISMAQRKNQSKGLLHEQELDLEKFSNDEKLALDLLCRHDKGLEIIQCLHQSLSLGTQAILSVDISLFVQKLIYDYLHELLDYMIVHKYLIMHEFLTSNEKTFNSSLSQKMVLEDLDKKFDIAQYCRKELHEKRKYLNEKLTAFRFKYQLLQKDQKFKHRQMLSSLYQERSEDTISSKREGVE